MTCGSPDQARNERCRLPLNPLEVDAICCSARARYGIATLIALSAPDEGLGFDPQINVAGHITHLAVVALGKPLPQMRLMITSLNRANL